MAIDFTAEPWSRLPKIAPPGTEQEDLELAATRHSLRADVFAAAADLWEEAAMLIDTSPDDPSDRMAAMVEQDGIKVQFAETAGQGARVAQQARYLQRARYWRAKAKPSSPLLHTEDDSPWVPYVDDDGFVIGEYETPDPDVYIPVEE